MNETSVRQVAHPILQQSEAVKSSAPRTQPQRATVRLRPGADSLHPLHFVQYVEPVHPVAVYVLVDAGVSDRVDETASAKRPQMLATLLRSLQSIY